MLQMEREIRKSPLLVELEKFIRVSIFKFHYAMYATKAAPS